MSYVIGSLPDGSGQLKAGSGKTSVCKHVSNVSLLDKMTCVALGDPGAYLQWQMPLEIYATSCAVVREDEMEDLDPDLKAWLDCAPYSTAFALPKRSAAMRGEPSAAFIALGPDSVSTLCGRMDANEWCFDPENGMSGVRDVFSVHGADASFVNRTTFTVEFHCARREFVEAASRTPNTVAYLAPTFRKGFNNRFGSFTFVGSDALSRVVAFMPEDSRWCLITNESRGLWGLIFRRGSQGDASPCYQLYSALSPGVRPSVTLPSSIVYEGISVGPLDWTPLSSDPTSAAAAAAKKIGRVQADCATALASASSLAAILAAMPHGLDLSRALPSSVVPKGYCESLLSTVTEILRAARDAYSFSGHASLLGGKTHVHAVTATIMLCAAGYFEASRLDFSQAEQALKFGGEFQDIAANSLDAYLAAIPTPNTRRSTIAAAVVKNILPLPGWTALHYATSRALTDWYDGALPKGGVCAVILKARRCAGFFQFTAGSRNFGARWMLLESCCWASQELVDVNSSTPSGSAEQDSFLRYVFGFFSLISSSYGTSGWSTEDISRKVRSLAQQLERLENDDSRSTDFLSLALLGYPKATRAAMQKIALSVGFATQVCNDVGPVFARDLQSVSSDVAILDDLGVVSLLDEMREALEAEAAFSHLARIAAKIHREAVASNKPEDFSRVHEVCNREYDQWVVANWFDAADAVVAGMRGVVAGCLGFRRFVSRFYTTLCGGSLKERSGSGVEGLRIVRSFVASRGEVDEAEGFGAGEALSLNSLYDVLEGSRVMESIALSVSGTVLSNFARELESFTFSSALTDLEFGHARFQATLAPCSPRWSSVDGHFAEVAMELLCSGRSARGALERDIQREITKNREKANAAEADISLCASGSVANDAYQLGESFIREGKTMIGPGQVVQINQTALGYLCSTEGVLLIDSLSSFARVPKGVAAGKGGSNPLLKEAFEASLVNDVFFFFSDESSQSYDPALWSLRAQSGDCRFELDDEGHLHGIVANHRRLGRGSKYYWVWHEYLGQLCVITTITGCSMLAVPHHRDADRRRVWTPQVSELLSVPGMDARLAFEDAGQASEWWAQASGSQASFSRGSLEFNKVNLEFSDKTAMGGESKNDLDEFDAWDSRLNRFSQ